MLGRRNRGWVVEVNRSVRARRGRVEVSHIRDGPRGHQVDRGGRVVSGPSAVQPPAVQAPDQAGPGHRGRAPAEGAGPEDPQEHPPAGRAYTVKYVIILEPTD